MSKASKPVFSPIKWRIIPTTLVCYENERGYTCKAFCTGPANKCSVNNSSFHCTILHHLQLLTRLHIHSALLAPLNRTDFQSHPRPRRQEECGRGAETRSEMPVPKIPRILYFLQHVSNARRSPYFQIFAALGCIRNLLESRQPWSLVTRGREQGPKFLLSRSGPLPLS